ncbi:MAG: urate oxidase [Planctomycetota bacterium]|nr:urate oxidase [Planctomycetota bacterium]
MELKKHSYGKSNIRLTKVVRRAQRHKLFEIEADIELEGDFQRSYTHGDNANCIATDSMKNTVYVLAKEHLFSDVEEFAYILGEHFIGTYPQVTKVSVELRQANWQRIEVGGEPHDHAFVSGGQDERIARVTARRGAPIEWWGGLRNLRVLKTTNSQWHTFVDDRYRTLPDARDRILATQIDADWRYVTSDCVFELHVAAIRKAILETFANHASLGVQQTLLAMGEAALEASDTIDRIDFTLPNLHRVPFNFEPFGLKFENDIFIATDEPYGLIKGTVEREPRP